MFVNRYAGYCNNPVCKKKVFAGHGFTQKVDNRYVLWCEFCVPERKSFSERLLTAEGKIVAPYERNNIDLIRAMPGAFWDGRNWSVSLNMADRRRVLEIADAIKLQVDPSLRIIETTDQTNSAMEAGLFPYQIEGVNFLSNKSKALLGDEMGLGKTVQSLMVIPRNTGSAMIVCRAGLKYNWFDEVKKWRKDLKPFVINGRNNFRWPKSGEVVIINNDILPEEFNTPKIFPNEKNNDYWDRLAVYRKELRINHPDAEKILLIVDEAHDYKNRNAARTRKVKEIARMSQKLIGLTGSPLTNRPEDLYNVLDVLGLAKEAFGSWGNFQSLYNASSNRFGITWGKPKPIVPELLRRVMLRRLRSDVLPDLPLKTYTNFLVGEIDASLKKSLDSLWEKWGTVIEIAEKLPPFEQFSEIREKLSRSRIPIMLDYIENAEEQDVPLVVFSAHLAPLDAILGRPNWAVITGVTSSEKRQEIVRAFQAGHLKGVGVSIKAGGVGINLTHAWKALFVDLDWTPSSNWQAEDRIARIGQKSNKVEIVRMVSDHPLDLHLQNLLSKKIDVIIRSIDANIEGQKNLPNNNFNETEEEFQSRMNAIAEKIQKESEKQENQKKEEAKSKVANIHSREKARLKKEVLPLTPERINSIRDSFKYMLSICDGAFQLDNLGFNKPDAIVAHWLLSAGLETEQELEAAYFILTRYKRQLSKKYPVLFS
jgi:SWI/SNF-related matrix-associated actin-dependent regulator of chromatin subfamily A-like protein 1